MTELPPPTSTQHPTQPAEKILTIEQAVERYGRPRERTLVFTNGVFDVLHRGHVEYLFLARALGEALVVGLNTDDSVRRLKGPTRPLNPLDDRAFVLAGLGCVDAVVPFGEDTPIELVRALLPDALVKGGDYTPDTVVGREEVEEAGGHVVIMPIVEGRSTTRLLERMKEGE